MFERAGAGGKAAKSHDQGDSSVTKAFAEAASAMSALYSTPTSKASQPSSYSPARVIESRSKLYNQLTELQNLKVQVFWMVWNIKKEKMVWNIKKEKETIMNLLKQLSTNK